MAFNSASLVYMSGSTNVSCSVYASYGNTVKYETDLNNYQQVIQDLSVIAKTSDVGSWGLEPKKSHVTLGGIKYLVGGVVTYVSDAYQWITLRVNNSKAP